MRLFPWRHKLVISSYYQLISQILYNSDRPSLCGRFIGQLSQQPEVHLWHMAPEWTVTILGLLGGTMPVGSGQQACPLSSLISIINLSLLSSNMLSIDQRDLAMSFVTWFDTRPIRFIITTQLGLIVKRNYTVVATATRKLVKQWSRNHWTMQWPDQAPVGQWSHGWYALSYFTGHALFKVHTINLA